MPSKGIQCYTYIAVDNIEVEFTVPKNSAKQSDICQFHLNHLEVESSNLGRFKFTGRFEFIVRRGGRELTKQWVDINSMTGKLEGGSIIRMDQTRSIIIDDVFIAFGFYDAGPGLANLPKQHQCYVSVSPNYENWMRDIIPQDDEKSNHPFHRMVLPAAHDIGMNSMATSLSLLQNAGTNLIKEVLGRSLPHAFSVLNKIGDGAVGRIAPDIIRALAITQKDSLDTIMSIGARYFEFRPAKCHRQLQRVSPLEDTLYFQHGAIPGMSYRQFLSDIIAFLASHSDEIIVVQNRWDGVPDDCPRPSEAELHDVLISVLNDTGNTVEVGTQDDMLNQTLHTLRSQNKRLIILCSTSQCSNYDDEANATLTGDSMVAALKRMAESPLPQNNAITLLQCQATATNIRDVIVASVLDNDVSTSPILATKGVCDGKILPLVRGDVGKSLGKEGGLVVLMNDFFEGGTADVAVGLCRERMG